MNTPKKGEVVRIRRGEPLLVIESHATISEDRLRGDSYHGWEVHTITVDSIGKTNPKVKVWTLDGFSMGGLNMVKAEEIRLLTAHRYEVVKKTEVTYHVTDKKSTK